MRSEHKTRHMSAERENGEERADRVRFEFKMRQSTQDILSIFDVSEPRSMIIYIFSHFIFIWYSSSLNAGIVSVRRLGDQMKTTHTHRLPREPKDGGRSRNAKR